MHDDARADYELPQDQITNPAPVAPQTADVPPDDMPRPVPQSFTVTLKRQFWTEEPKGLYEVSVSLTCEPDRSFPTRDNLDIVHRLLRTRLTNYLDGQRPPEISPSGGH